MRKKGGNKKRYMREKRGAPLGIKKAMYLKGGTVSPFIQPFKIKIGDKSKT